MTHEAARARGAVTGKSHGESQPALGRCPELLTGEFPFYCAVVPLEEEEEDKERGLPCTGSGAGLYTTGRVALFDPSTWVRVDLSRLWPAPPPLS